MRLLALDASLANCSAAVLVDGLVVSEQAVAGGQGKQLALLAEAVLATAGVRPAALEAVAVSVGPGSFTGLRASSALARGLACVAAAEPVGVSLLEVFKHALPAPIGRTLWVAVDSRRINHLFLAANAPFRSVARAALPVPSDPIIVAGDAAAVVVADLVARGADALLAGPLQPRARDVGAVALRRLAWVLPPLAAVPLYVDPPAVHAAR